jgi:type IX secretion system PorP/SprF family membrane protein
MKKTGYLSLILLFVNIIGNNVVAQQQAIYNQFAMNKYLYNPAAAGCDYVSSVKLIGHEQWVGFGGSPKYYTVTFDSRVFGPNHSPSISVRKKDNKRLIKPESVGIGGQLFNERTGPLSLTGLNGTYAYHINLGQAQLSFGLSLVISNYILHTNQVVLADDKFDNLIDGGKTNRWITDFNFGSIFSSRDYFIGYSTTQVLGSNLQFGKGDGGEHKINRIHLIMGGYNYAVNKDFLIEPVFLLKLPEGSKAQLDMDVKVTLKENYWCGLIFRTGPAFSIFGGLNYDRYSFSYAFDYNFNTMRKYSYGSHEFILGVQLGENVKRYRWLNNY